MKTLGILVVLGFVCICEPADLRRVKRVCLGEQEQKRVESIVPVMLQSCPQEQVLIDLLNQDFPTVLTKLIMGYHTPYTHAYGMRIPHGISDSRYTTQGKSLESADYLYLYGGNVEWYGFGVKDDMQLPLMHGCHFAPALNFFNKPPWDYEQIGSWLCPERSQQFASRKGDGASLVTPLIEEKMLYFLSLFLVKSKVTAKSRKDPRVIEAQEESLLFTAPGIGPREFAQLLKNGALYVTQTYPKRKRMFSFYEAPYKPDPDALVSKFDQYSKVIDQVINDPTGDLILYFERNKKEAC